tara:strand:+ start:746 stop:982 length:237 start_codon:yes stop_codon:yes gene_type:complete
MATNLETYENYLLENISSYTVTEIVGRGKYNITPFTNFKDAKDNITVQKSKNPLGRFLVYGISTPSNQPFPISVPITL